MKRSITARQRRFIIRVENEWASWAPSIASAAEAVKGTLRSRRQLRGAPLTAFLAPARK
jgi:hypothetical protein